MVNLTIKFGMHLSEKGKERIETARREKDLNDKKLTELIRIASSPEHIVILDGEEIYRIHESGFGLGEKRGSETVPEEVKRILVERLPRPLVELKFEYDGTTVSQRRNGMVSSIEIGRVVDFYNSVAEGFYERMENV
ncbi:MAG: hypothetical protein KKH88_02905 [Nanoarchaeota archaeon]|nr:hypothetical protein [Nanoarchaeota archaeon]